MESTWADKEALLSTTRYCPWYIKTKAAILIKSLLSSMSSYSQESRTLLSALCRQLETALPLKAPPPPGLLECSSCEGFMVQPLCLPCGHSVCKSCLDKLRSSLTHSILCPRCKHTYPHKPPGSTSDRKPTLVLQNAFQKWYPTWLEACSHRMEGNRFAREGDFPLAVDWYNKAAETGVRDHRVLGNRSRSYLAMEQLEEALRDGEACCKLRPSWAKGHFRRASVLEKVGRWREAVVEYLLCLHLGGNDQFVVKAVCKLLDQHLPDFQEDHHSEGDGCSVGEIVRLCVEVMAGYESDGDGSDGVVDVPSHLLDQSDFECVLCTGLLYSPTTTVCGHSFCQICLSRSFDHSPLCPVCRSPLVENFKEHCQTSGKMSVDVTLEGLLLCHFPVAYEEKRAQVEAELQKRARAGLSEAEELPVFLCTMAYPGMPCPLHIFEPKYRLMIRRCMETNSRRFGMCHPSDEEGSVASPFATYGTVLHIDSVENTVDGRALITTVGEKRFRVVSKRVTDGYNTARIEFITDAVVTEEEEIASLRALQQEVYDYAHQWLSALPYSCRILLMQTSFGPLPNIDPTPECCPNGPKWVWWYVHVLPTSYERKLKFLKSKSLRQRLLMLKESLHLPTNVR